MTTIICPGCGHCGELVKEVDSWTCPDTGAWDESAALIDCKKCGLKMWADSDIARAYEDSEAVWNLEMGA